MGLGGFLQKRSAKLEDDTNEGIVETQDELSLKIEDAELVIIIDQRISAAKPAWNAAKQIMDVNEAYWQGHQLDPTKLYEHNAKVVENRVFMALETVVPIITSRKRNPVVVPQVDTDEARSLAEKVRKFLNYKYDSENMTLKIEQLVRHILLYRIGILKYRWDEEVDDFVTEVVRPQKVVIDHRATTPDNVEFLAEYMEHSLSQLKEMYPAKKELLNKEYSRLPEGTLIKYVEFWTPEMTVTKIGGIILDKKKNPHWNWEVDPEEKKKGSQSQLKNTVSNHFSSPRLPYVLFPLFSLGKSIYGDTDLVDQVRTLQDGVNKRKRQISDSADQAAGVLAASGDFISKKEFAKYTGAPDERIWIQRGNPQQALVRLTPQPLANQVFQDLLDSKNSIDNIFGTHSTTRGERQGTETATGRQLLRESDFGRIDMLVRNIDKRLEELYNGWVQMAKVFYTDIEFIRIMGKEGAHTYLEFSRDDVQDGIEIHVLTEITADKATVREEAIQLFQMKLIDPLTFFEKLDIPNPKEMTRRMVIFMLDPKLYLMEFATDENTPGMENDPVSVAKKENQRLIRGEFVRPFEGVVPEHLKIHTDEMELTGFKERPADVKRAFINVVRGEMEILREQQRSAQGIMGNVAPQGAQGLQAPAVAEAESVV